MEQNLDFQKSNILHRRVLPDYIQYPTDPNVIKYINKTREIMEIPENKQKISEFITNINNFEKIHNMKTNQLWNDFVYDQLQHYIIEISSIFSKFIYQKQEFSDIQVSFTDSQISLTQQLFYVFPQFMQVPDFLTNTLYQLSFELIVMENINHEYNQQYYENIIQFFEIYTSHEYYIHPYELARIKIKIMQNNIYFYYMNHQIKPKYFKRLLLKCRSTDCDFFVWYDLMYYIKMILQFLDKNRFLRCSCDKYRYVNFCNYNNFKSHYIEIFKENQLIIAKHAKFYGTHRFRTDPTNNKIIDPIYNEIIFANVTHIKKYIDDLIKKYNYEISEEDYKFVLKCAKIAYYRKFYRNIVNVLFIKN